MELPLAVFGHSRGHSIIPAIAIILLWSSIYADSMLTCIIFGVKHTVRVVRSPTEIMVRQHAMHRCVMRGWAIEATYNNQVIIARPGAGPSDISR